MSHPSSQLERIDEAAESLREALGGEVPSVAIVAGSGLGALSSHVESARSVSYSEIRHFPASTVVGHAGKLVAGKLGGRDAVVMSGRKHLYEGVEAEEAVLPVRALVRAGVRVLILSNAAGSMNRQIVPGDLMLIEDHVGLQFRNPLIGPNDDRLGPRFPDMSEPYDRELMALAREVALEQGVNLKEGVYLALSGPTYETQAEVGAYRQIADAVGMSTVPETLVALHAGARVLGISVITNSHVLRLQTLTTHDEVIEMGKSAGVAFCALVEGIVARIPESA